MDILAFFPASKVYCFVPALGADWYADEDSIARALRDGRSFNVIYNPAVYKFDIFPVVSHFHREQLSRSTFETFEFAGERVRFPVLSAEDVVLSKLAWYKKSGGALSRQLEDIRGVLAVNPQMDRHYLAERAENLV